MSYDVSCPNFYISNTCRLIKKLRFGESFDDSTGLMVPNKLLLQTLYATKYNFRTMSSFSVLVVLRNYIIGFEGISPEICDVDSIKYAVCELI